MAQGEPNLEGAIKVLVDLLTANGFNYDSFTICK